MVVGQDLEAPETVSAVHSPVLPHISVCICTYRRTKLLWRLLDALSRQQTGGLFTYSAVIADNDKEKSAQTTVARARAELGMSIEYCMEPRQNIALARNKVVDNAAGDLIAFIDDDEFPADNWLLALFRARITHDVDGVLGPVLRHFDETPPKWVEKSSLYVRRVNPTGMEVEWQEARTGNVLLKRELIDGDPLPFRPEFRAGEDQDFFRRKIAEGCRFIWCAEAKAFETVSPARWKRKYLLRKALLRGATAGLHTDVAGVTKSIVAIPLYLLILPFALVSGQHVFMPLLVKICDHLGKLLILVGINPIREEYVLDDPATDTGGNEVCVGRSESL
jgi:glycosyltransferase involved in cell wall biosynthesis